MLGYAPVRTAVQILVVALIGSTYVIAADNPVMRDRRQRAATAFHDGILFVHAKSELDLAADGFRQDPFFYYLTGLENTVGAVFAIEGKSGEGWLFLPSRPPFLKSGLQPEVQPGADAAKRLGIEHVVDWSELEAFLAQRAGSRPRLYYADDPARFEELPPNVLSRKAPQAPLWVQVILQKWTSFRCERSVGAGRSSDEGTKRGGDCGPALGCQSYRVGGDGRHARNPPRCVAEKRRGCC